MLVTITNRHAATPPVTEEWAGRYIGYFENSEGKQLVFVYNRGEGHATVYHGDDNWRGHQVREAPPGELDRMIRDKARELGVTPEDMRESATAITSLYPFVGSLVLGSEEQAWLRACWEASRPLREQV